MKPRAKSALSLALVIVGGIAAGMRCDASEWVENSSQYTPRLAAYTVKAYTGGFDPFVPIKFIRRAKKELIVIDAYPGVATLDMLAKRGRGVKIELVTHSNGELEESDFEAFGAQCGKFTKTICGICHDRFIIVDQKEIFWTGASLKDAGRLTFAAAKMGPEIIPGLLDSIRKATSERREYGMGSASAAQKHKVGITRKSRKPCLQSV